LIILGFIVSFYNQNVVSEKILLGKNLASMMHSLLLEDFIYSDYVSIIQKVNNLHKVHHFDALVAENAGGETIHMIGRAGENKAYGESEPLMRFGGKTLLAFQTKLATKERSNLGSIRFTLDISPEIAAKNRLLFFLTALILAFSLIEALLLVVIFQKMFVPFGEILQNLSQLASGVQNKFNKYLNRSDEIGRLNTDYNKVVDSLLVFQNKLAEQSKLAAIGQTTAMLAHDVRKPFSQVKTVLNQFEMMKTDGALLETAKKEIEKTILSVEKMVDDIMDYSREVALETKPCPLASLLDFSLRLTAKSFKDKELDVICEYRFNHTTKPLVDDERISRVFTNILGNGIEAITVIGKKDKGTISISTMDVQQDDQRFVQIVIGNDGPPFNEADIPSLFESYFTKGKKKGTGLGLSSAHKIVTLHGGSISARNRADGLGVEFVMLLPASAETDEMRADSLPKTLKDVFVTSCGSSSPRTGDQLAAIAQNYSRLKIVLLEDETLYRAYVRNVIVQNEILDRMITLYDAHKVDDAVALIERENIGLAIVDIDLQENKDGYDFLQLVRDKKLPVSSLMHSNRCIKEDIARAYTLGVLGYVGKPLGLEELVNFLFRSLFLQETNVSAGAAKMESKGEEPSFTQPKMAVEKTSLSAKTSAPLLIYIADDSSLFRMHHEFTIKEALKEFTCEIQCFEKPETLLERHAKEPARIVISDNHFDAASPMLGTELLKTIRAQDATTLTYLSSNLLESELQEKAAAVGANGYFPPDADAGEMAAVILKDLVVIN
jgi:signal transduction histidine kinase/DNA-binding NarL/FixJ family response regulator